MAKAKPKSRQPLKKADIPLKKLGKAIKIWFKRPYVHHGIRVLLLLVLAWFSLLLTPGRGPTQLFLGIDLGRVADRDVISPFEFSVYKSEQALVHEQEESSAGVLPVLEFIPQVEERVLQDLKVFFDKLETVATDSALAEDIIGWDAYVKGQEAENWEYTVDSRLLNALYSVHPELYLSDEEVIYLLDTERRNKLHRLLQVFISESLDEGLISRESAREIGNRSVRLGRDDRDQQVQLEDITQVERVVEKSRDVLVDPEYPEPSKDLFVETLNRFIRPNIVYNSAETERQRRLAVRKVKPTRDQAVLEGEKIIGRGERVSPEQIEKLNNLRTQLLARNQDRYSFVRKDIGLYLIYLALLFCIGIFLFIHQRKTYRQLSVLLIIFISLLLVLAFSYLILITPQLSNHLIPVAICSMLVAYLIGNQKAMVVTFVLALILGVQAGFSSVTSLLALMGGMAGAVSVRGVISRKGQYLSILYITSAYLVGILAIDYGIRGEGIIRVSSAAGWSLLNAFICTMVTVGLLPLFEYIFKITSNFTLLELSDLNRPLLKRMAIEAPGTYHHSIILGNLAEAAAAGIEANPVYARVASYYHDIGKMTKPNYFIENQGGRANPHNKLSPKMSSLIIANHVKEGLELARKARLPKCIIDVIEQHHGNTPISFFFNKEKEQNPNTTLVERDFCYPGPRPMSKEAAIIMLADAVESASRVLNDPTPSRIKGLIKKVIDDKLHKGQLNTADLTLKDLNRIAEEFLTILIGVHHQRIDYPQSTEKVSDAKTRPVRNKNSLGPNGENNGKAEYSN
jgi:cyclic-di-AMP phosphodiesterase PgpH